MSAPLIEIKIRYRSRPREDAPSLELPSVPRVGEHLEIREDRYRVVEVRYIDDLDGRSSVVIEVEWEGVTRPQ